MDASLLRRTAMLLIGADLVLALVYLVEVLLGSPSGTLHYLVNLDAEGTVAVWYTSGKLLLAGMLFLLPAGGVRPVGDAAEDPSMARANMRPTIASTAVRLPSGGGSRRERLFPVAVGLALLFLSLDETASLHEQITRSLRPFEALPRFTGDHGMWIPFLLVGVAGFLIATRRSWRELWRRERRGAALMGAGLGLGLLGAVSLEIVSYELIRPAGARTLYVVEVALEELLEMLGATLLLMGSALVCRTRLATIDSEEAAA